MWRVGNGKSIQKWKDKWILSHLTYKVQSTINFFDVEARVSTLIDEDRKVWNREVVEAVFNKEEAHRICSIPISIRGA